MSSCDAQDVLADEATGRRRTESADTQYVLLPTVVTGTWALSRTGERSHYIEAYSGGVFSCGAAA